MGRHSQSNMVYLGKIRQTAEAINQKYFIDETTLDIGDRRLEGWNTLAGLVGYAGRKNTLLLGRPGTGKTTYASLISSVMSGLPFDLYDYLKIQGHPDQTKDTMLARADLGRLAEEGVVWQPSVYLPSVLFDELNRNSPGKQSIVLEYIRTGKIEHLGKFFQREKPAFFATLNYNGVGTYPISQPTLDRFDLSIEFSVGSSLTQDYIEEAANNIERDFADHEQTGRIIEQLLKKDMDVAKKLEYLNHVGEELKRKRESKELPYIEDRKLASLDLPLTPEALTFLRAIHDELNSTYRNGENRSVDDRDKSDHNKSFASSKIKEGSSNRAWRNIQFYSAAAAMMLEDEAVGVEHVRAVAPYVLSHRLDFDPDYAALFVEQPRLFGERREMDLTRRLLRETEDNLRDVAPAIKIADAFLSGKGLTHQQLQELKGFGDSNIPDHPLLRNYWEAVREKLKN